MLKRSWIILLALVVILLSSPTAVQADGSVCEMDGIQYETLLETLALVGSGESKTITILQDIDHNNGIAIDNRHVTFDLNGFTVTIISCHVIVHSLTSPTYLTKLRHKHQEDVRERMKSEA